MYTEIYMDILNKCNAKCKYCLTGMNNVSGESDKVPTYYMDVKKFDKLASHMRDSKMISEDALFRIYSWYEPTLNPHLPDIINYTHDQGYRLDMSTNGSVVPDFSKIDSCEHFHGLLFSMPGFSQESYDKIHKFDFETIKDNIRTIVKEFKARGFIGDAYINYHLYQFNLDEVLKAKEFADEIGIRLNTMYAYFNGNYGGREYLNGTIEKELLIEASKDLFFHYIDELYENKEKYFKKFEEPESIALSEFCNLLPHRGGCNKSSIASIFDFNSYEELKMIYEKVEEEMHSSDEIVKGWLWGLSYKESRNHLFGLND